MNDPTWSEDQKITAALETVLKLDYKHSPTIRAKRPGWKVCNHDSMTWPCETRKALDAFGVIYMIYSRMRLNLEEGE